MIAWMMYAALVALALSTAALVAERAAKVRRAATRWVWMASLAGSLILPTVIATVSIRVPEALESSAAPTAIVLRDKTSIPMPSMLLDLGGAQAYDRSAHIDTLMRDAWIAASAWMALALALLCVLLHRRKRDWSEAHLCGERVLLAPDAGPAVVGLLRSHIVVPVWLLQASKAQQQCTIAHERSHLNARDPQLVALALALLTLMPWNPLLWWQFHRLRRAIEVDCDARVLRSGHDIGAYCETLIQVGQHQSSRIGVVPAMSDSVSFLEQRIRHMLRKPKKWARASAAAMVCVSLGMAAFAAQVTPPDANHQSANNTVVLSNDTLERYAGFYQISTISLVTITRAGNGLTLSISGQMAAPKPMHIVPLSEDKFAVEGINATVHFITNSDGRVLRLVARQNGRDVLDASRVDKATADRVNAAMAARIKAQKPFPGSEKALQLLLSDPDSGAGMSEDLARIRTEQKASREKYLAELGPVESYTFTGVNPFGYDSYLVKHEHGTETVLLTLDEKGTLITAFRHR
ncbi:MAG TPA: M56 family metallopeptidase [Dyella sp.]|nr:M56 family metallopeptidase [Dyella sp.]